MVDASVAAKWFLPEPDAAAALRLLDGPHRLAAPDLIRSEFGNIVWKLHTRGVLDTNEASEMIEHFLSMPLEIHDSTYLLAPPCRSPSPRIARCTTVSIWLWPWSWTGR